MKSKSEKKNRIGTFLYTVLILLFLAVIGVSSYNLVKKYLEYKQSEEMYDSLMSYTIEKPEEPEETENPDDSQALQSADEAMVESETDSPEEDSEEQNQNTKKDEKNTEQDQEKESYSQDCDFTLDFDALKAMNPDFVCWIYFPALGISYPVVQGRDNNWYQHRTFDGADNFAGTLFIDAGIEHPLDDPHTIIYGHNMRNQTMFGKLKFLPQNDLYGQSLIFWILTADAETAYQVADIKYTEENSSVYRIFSAPSEEYLEYLRQLYANSGIQNKMLPEVSEDCKLVTLSTCSAADGPGRLVVQGVAVQ